MDLARRPQETTRLMTEATSYENISTNIRQSAARVRL